jgi:hypothetical protein
MCSNRVYQDPFDNLMDDNDFNNETISDESDVFRDPVLFLNSFHDASAQLDDIITRYQYGWMANNPSLILMDTRLTEPSDHTLLTYLLDLDEFRTYLRDGWFANSTSAIEEAMKQLLYQRVSSLAAIYVNLNALRVGSIYGFLDRLQVDITIAVFTNPPIEPNPQYLKALNLTMTHPFNVTMSTHMHLAFDMMITETNTTRLQLNALFIHKLPAIDFSSAQFDWVVDDIRNSIYVVHGEFASLRSTACLDVARINIAGGLSLRDDEKVFKSYLFSPRIDFIGRYILLLTC